MIERHRKSSKYIQTVGTGVALDPLDFLWKLFCAPVDLPDPWKPVHGLSVELNDFELIQNCFVIKSFNIKLLSN